jgi:hypothetical protein
VNNRVAFHELGATDFPFVIEFFREDNGEVVHRIVVTGPGGIKVPALAKRFGVGIGVRIGDMVVHPQRDDDLG